MNEKSALKSFGFAFLEFLRVFQSFKQAISEVSEKVPEKSVLGKTISSLWIDVWEKKKKAKSRPSLGVRKYSRAAWHEETLSRFILYGLNKKVGSVQNQITYRGRL